MKKHLFIKIVAMAVLLAGSAGAGWYFYFREPHPDEVIAKMTLAMQNLSSHHYEAALEVEVDYTDILEAVEAKGEVQSFGSFLPASSKIDLNLLLSGDNVFDEKGLVDRAQNEMRLYANPDGGNDTLFMFDLDSKIIDKITYLKLDDFGFFIPFDLSAIFGQWYEMDDVKQFDTLRSQKEAITGVPEEDKMEEKALALRALVLEKPLLKYQETLASEVINEAETYHYRTVINTEMLPEFITSLLEIFDLPSTEDTESIVDQAVNYLKDVSVEVWIGKDDFYLYRSVLNTHVDYVVEEEMPPIKINFSLAMNQSLFDEPVEIIAPENTKSQEELMGDIMGGVYGGLFGGLPASGERDQSIFGESSDAGTLSDGELNTQIPGSGDADGDGLSDAAERLWGSNPNQPDTDGDGYLDGEEVDNGYNPAGSGKLF